VAYTDNVALSLRGMSDCASLALVHVLQGITEMPPAVVAEKARIVYTTLEQVAPQFPSDGD
jgi:hypothetical protein